MAGYQISFGVSSKDLKYLRWAEFGAKQFSTCARRQYMAIILAPDGRVAGTGYNGFPAGISPHCNEGGCPRAKELPPSGSPYGLSCLANHAEANALMYSDRMLRMGGTMYINGQPCPDCGKLIANSGLSRMVIVKDETYQDGPKVNALMNRAGIMVVEVDRSALIG